MPAEPNATREIMRGALPLLTSKRETLRLPFGSVRLSVPTPKWFTLFCNWPLTRISPLTSVPTAPMMVP
jgi:hypothetical protein